MGQWRALYTFCVFVFCAQFLSISAWGAPKKKEEPVSSSQTIRMGQDFAADMFNGMQGQSRFRTEVGNPAYIDYKTIEVPSKIFLINTQLLEEWGLKGVNGEKLSQALIRSIQKAFARRIINEFDPEPSPEEIQPGLFMATRYMYTGDGRAIWNGQLDIYDKTGKLIAVVDVSSKGTGSTAMRLTKDLTDGYGDGKAQLDEFVGGYIQGEIMHRNGFQTERTLAILDLGNGQSIGVRVGAPLLRPSHIFYWENRANAKMTKNVIDYAIKMERLNGRGADLAPGRNIYERWLKVEAQALGKLIAMVESRYVFLWLAVDGDNMLLPGGIIDYGSVRQFGLPYFDFRHENRSISVWETKDKAKLILSKLIRSVYLAKTGKKAKGNHDYTLPLFDVFEKSYKETKIRDLLLQFGFTPEQIESLVSNNYEEGKELVNAIDGLMRLTRNRAFRFNYIGESEGYEKFTPPLYDVRNLLRRYAEKLAAKSCAGTLRCSLSTEELLSLLKSKWSTKESLSNSGPAIPFLESIQANLSTLVKALDVDNRREQWELMARRAQIANREFRLTGNAGTEVSKQIINLYNKGATPEEINRLAEHVINQNIEDPERLQARTSNPARSSNRAKSNPSRTPSCPNLLKWEKKLDKIMRDNFLETSLQKLFSDRA